MCCASWKFRNDQPYGYGDGVETIQPPQDARAARSNRRNAQRRPVIAVGPGAGDGGNNGDDNGNHDDRGRNNSAVMVIAMVMIFVGVLVGAFLSINIVHLHIFHFQLQVINHQLYFHVQHLLLHHPIFR